MTKITVSGGNAAIDDAFDEHMLQEDQHTEFKTSVFVDPVTQTPGVKQMFTIAATLAAFMNAEGGTLFLGLADDKKAKGVEGDLAILATQPDMVELHTAHGNDTGYAYGATKDKFELKLRAIAKAFLSANAQALVGRVLFGIFDGRTICRVEVKPCAPDDFVYTYFKQGPNPEIAEIYVRYGNQKRKLLGVDRDEFVSKRVHAGFAKQMESVRAAMAGAGGDSALVASVQDLIAKFDANRKIGPAVSIVGAHPFEESVVKAARKPKSLVWDGAHDTDVSSWQELILKVLEKLQGLDAGKFDELADSPEFDRYLVKVLKPREHHADCFPKKFGAAGAVRVKRSLGNKVYLYQPDKVLRKLIAAFGVDVARFMFTAE